jgi:hypothetical protein
MKNIDDPHLPEDRVILALADEDSLHQEELAHLHNCPVCTADLGRIERALACMGRAAAELTPPFRRRIALPSRTFLHVFRKPFRLGSGLRTPWVIGAATAAVGLMVAFGGILSRNAQDSQLAGIRQEMIDDARFLRELSKLEESGLPEMSAALTDEFDPDEDDFLDFVVPDPTGNATTRVPPGENVC